MNEMTLLWVLAIVCPTLIILLSVTVYSVQVMRKEHPDSSGFRVWTIPSLVMCVSLCLILYFKAGGHVIKWEDCSECPEVKTTEEMVLPVLRHMASYYKNEAKRETKYQQVSFPGAKLESVNKMMEDFE